MLIPHFTADTHLRCLSPHCISSNLSALLITLGICCQRR